MSKCQKCQSFWKVIHAHAHTHAYIHTHHARENNWHFDILTFLEFILLIFNVLIDLQKLHFWFFIFASRNFCKSKLLSLTWENGLPWRGGKTEYLAFEGTKRFLGINPLAVRIESRSGQILRQFDGLSKFSWHRICIYRKKAVPLQQPKSVGELSIIQNGNNYGRRKV